MTAKQKRAIMVVLLQLPIDAIICKQGLQQQQEVINNARCEQRRQHC
jgi:hypothetical protein